jgi:hypothetical protein
MILSRAHWRLTAVGRVDRIISYALASSLKKIFKLVVLLLIAAKANPNAAVTPIAGAPLTTSFLIAFATSI